LVTWPTRSRLLQALASLASELYLVACANCVANGTIPLHDAKPWVMSLCFGIMLVTRHDDAQCLRNSVLYEFERAHCVRTSSFFMRSRDVKSSVFVIEALCKHSYVPRPRCDSVCIC